MDTTIPLPLLGGLTPGQFMKRHWQKKPLLVRGAMPHFSPPLGRSELFALAARDEVESRLVVRDGKRWTMRQGPFTRRTLPALTKPLWTLLVQGVDLHDGRGHELLQQFAFLPHARLDDLMVSYATQGGGVGPHFDSYDVFLLQAQGQRRWRIGRQKDLSLRDDVPLKILARFEPEAEYLLEAGDMLYLPPGYAHDGEAMNECQTYSIGFRAPARGELARELLQRVAEDAADNVRGAIYSDPRQDATETPGSIPEHLQEFALDAVRAALKEPLALECALGEYLTEPKANVWFEARDFDLPLSSVTLDQGTRMMYDAKHIFINGDSYLASGRDATLMRMLADRRSLTGVQLSRASDDALALIESWCEAGWAHEAGA
ncbi:MAG: cupin domain-containing protein [Pseudomonadota bacterium]